MAELGASGLRGRDPECEAVRHLVTGAREGRSGVLVVHGEAGIGKSALLREAASVADAFAVHALAGMESEAGLGFAALHRLLGPLRSEWEALPAPQRTALHVIFGLEEGPAPDLFLVGLATLTILDDAARNRPVLLLLDDSQWLDSESLSVLTFVARRLAAESIAMIFAFRIAVEGPADLPEGLPRLALGPLPPSDAAELLRSVAGSPLDAAVSERVLRECGGSPLAIIELSGALTPDQLLAADSLPQALPVSERLRRHYLRQLEELPGDARTTLLAAAASGTRDPGVLQRAGVALGLDSGAADQVESSGLARLAPEIAFRHPLIRSAVLSSASQSELRQVHRALADAIDGDHHAEARVWHLAAASFGPDDVVAQSLDDQADIAHRRGSRATEAALRAQAAELTQDPEHRARRQVRAADAYLLAGSLRRAEQLIDTIPDLSGSDVILAEASRIRALLASFATPGPVPRMLLDAADLARPEAPLLAARIEAEAVQTALVSCQLTEELTPAEVSRRVLAVDDGRNHLAEVVELFQTGFATRLSGDYATGARLLRQALDLCSRADDDLLNELEQWPVFVNNLPAELWEADRSGVVLDRMERFARRRGALGSLRITLGIQAHLAMWQGRFAAAEVAHDEATSISVALGGEPAAWEVLKVELYAWRGDEPTTRFMADLMTGDLAVATGAGVVVNIARVALVTLCLGLGNYAEATAAGTLLAEADVPPQGNQCLSDLIEAATRSDNAYLAQAMLARLEERAAASPTEWALGLVARCRALMAGAGDAQAHYVESIDRLSSTAITTELARSHLLYGEWLRRQNRRSDARMQLRTAHDLFARMGAEAFRERSRIELSATGERVRRRTADTVEELTPQELQIASLAAGGQTNREIAAALFISGSTVDYHLGKVFRKLGVSSRRTLRRTLTTA